MSRRAFTLVELLVTIAIIAVLAAVLMPSLARGKVAARRADCMSSLHQLGLATQLYWDDHRGRCFQVSYGSTNNGWLYWFGWLGNGAEGQRPGDLSVGVLYPYLQESSVRLCPALYQALAQFKLKADRAIYGYGYNQDLSGPQMTVEQLKKPTETALFADAAQVNDFQYPATRSNPMIEEWFWLDDPTNKPGPGYYPHGHFRHSQQANVAFCDGHVGAERLLPGSLDLKLPSQHVGRLRPEILVMP
jgi:prepilin-type N-terminal cleavage/methylation domain-containing protein/prepilin-type processing-associated H-X9-DG protein